MALDHTRITSAAKTALSAHGMKPDDVPFMSTGKGALELIIDEIAKAVIDEIKNNAVVSVRTKVGNDANTKLNSVFSAGVPVPTDGGAALQIAWIAGSAVPNPQESEGNPSLSTGGIT